MANVEWVLSEAQAEVINDRSKYLVVEGAAGSLGKQFLQPTKQ